MRKDFKLGYWTAVSGHNPDGLHMDRTPTVVLPELANVKRTAMRRWLSHCHIAVVIIFFSFPPHSLCSGGTFQTQALRETGASWSLN